MFRERDAMTSSVYEDEASFMVFGRLASSRLSSRDCTREEKLIRFDVGRGETKFFVIYHVFLRRRDSIRRLSIDVAKFQTRHVLSRYSFRITVFSPTFFTRVYHRCYRWRDSRWNEILRARSIRCGSSGSMDVSLILFNTVTDGTGERTTFTRDGHRRL